MSPEQDARNLRKSKLLPETVAEFRALLLERLLSCEAESLVAARAAITSIDELAETLRDRIDEHAGDGDAAE